MKPNQRAFSIALLYLENKLHHGREGCCCTLVSQSSLPGSNPCCAMDDCIDSRASCRRNGNQVAMFHSSITHTMVRKSNRAVLRGLTIRLSGCSWVRSDDEKGF